MQQTKSPTKKPLTPDDRKQAILAQLKKLGATGSRSRRQLLTQIPGFRLSAKESWYRATEALVHEGKVVQVPTGRRIGRNQEYGLRLPGGAPASKVPVKKGTQSFSDLLPGPVQKAFADVRDAARKVKRGLAEFRAKLEKAKALVIQTEQGTTQLKALLEAQRAHGEEVEKLVEQFH